MTEEKVSQDEMKAVDQQEEETRKRREKNLYNIRFLVGVYLLYLVYSLSKNFAMGQEMNAIVAGGAILLFAVAGAVMVFTSLRYMVKNKKDKSNK